MGSRGLRPSSNRNENDSHYTTRRSALQAPDAILAPTIDTRRASDRTLFLAGWAPWRGLAPGQSLAIYSGAPLRVVTAQRAERPDVAAALHDDSLRSGGFVLELAREDGAPIGDHPALCLVARDALAGTATLIEPGAPSGKTR